MQATTNHASARCAQQRLNGPPIALDGWFAIRCVHVRPNCGPLHEDVVSERTEPFQLASFFDPDAPARPIRIGLPIDTTPAGLRKFDRNTAFVISILLCGQIARLKGLTFGDLVPHGVAVAFAQRLGRERRRAVRNERHRKRPISA